MAVQKERPMPKKRKDKELEADVKDGIKEVLDDTGWWWWMPPSSQYSKVGISDFHAVNTSVFMVIEAKRGSAPPEPTANQIAFLQKVRGNGHFAFVVNLPRVPILRGFLEAFKRATIAGQKGEKPTPEDGAYMLDAMRIMQQEF